MIREIYKIRDILGVLGFGVIWISSQRIDFFPAIILHIAGSVLRFFSAGYIGPHYRDREMITKIRYKGGVYKLLDHPLYLGNFLLVLGTLFLYNPPFLVFWIFVSIFILIYSLFAFEESRGLKKAPIVRTRFNLTNAMMEKNTLFIILVIYALAFLRKAVS